MVLAAGGQPSEHAHQREARHAGYVGSTLPHAGLVDQSLSDVEDDRLHSQAAICSRSAFVVTFSSRGSPSTHFTRPPRASTSDEQSVAADRSPE